MELWDREAKEFTLIHKECLQSSQWISGLTLFTGRRGKELVPFHQGQVIEFTEFKKRDQGYS